MGKKQFLVIGIILIVIAACSKESIETTFFAGFKNPAHFPQPAYNLAGNPITKEGFELGRKLFYDARLSRNNTISCGNCHIQTSAFTQHGHDVSHGIDDRLGRRNSPPIMNLAWMPSFMWDGGVFDLDLQPIAPITAHEEMDESISNVISKLKADAQYPTLFKKAFGNDNITTAQFMKALSQFMLMCISSNSKYDSVVQNIGSAKFTAAEAAGRTLVQQKCGSCHAEPLFTNNSFQNNGIAIGANNDMGHNEVTLRETDKYRFKVPSLRNLSYTAPFMHDGRFYTLDAVINHYSNNILATPNLASQLPVGGMQLTEDEKQHIKAFLLTLNDRNFIENKLLSEQ